MSAAQAVPRKPSDAQLSDFALAAEAIERVQAALRVARVPRVGEQTAAGQQVPARERAAAERQVAGRQVAGRQVAGQQVAGQQLAAGHRVAAGHRAAAVELLLRAAAAPAAAVVR